MAMRILIFFGTALLMLFKANAVPANYDQRQDGQYNVHAQLENLVFLIAVPSSNNNLLSQLASQALEFKQRFAARSDPLEEHGLDATFAVYKSAEENSKEPYSVEIVRIDENPSNKENLARNTEEDNIEISKISNQQYPISNVATDGQSKSQNVDRKARSVKGLQHIKNGEMPTILGYLVDTRKMMESKMEDGRARNVVENVWNLDLDLGRPGTSLKKQLFHMEDVKGSETEENIASSLHSDRNNVAFSEEKQPELRLLGDGIENCGPGRYRDTSGICQFDKSAGSLL